MTDREQLGVWRDAVVDGLVTAGIYTAKHDEDPRQALHELLAWEVQVALDPAVSKAAAALVAQTRRQALAEAFGAIFEMDVDLEERLRAQAAIRKIAISEGEQG